MKDVKTNGSSNQIIVIFNWLCKQDKSLIYVLVGFS